MYTRDELEKLQSYQNKIYSVYENALQTASARKNLKSELLKVLSTNINAFESTIDNLIGNLPPKKITINSTRFSLGMFWQTSCCGNGSLLRTALIQAKADVDPVKKEYALYQQRLIIQKLESHNLCWNDFDELRIRIDNSWPHSIKYDLAYLIDFKQAEFLFVRHILPYQISCRSAIFAVEDILFQLCMKNGVNMIERIETSKSNLQEFFIQRQNIDFQHSLKYKNVATIFIEICKEWFQIIAMITFSDRVLDSTKGIFQINEVKDFWERFGNGLNSSYGEHLRSLIDMCRTETGFAFLKIMIKKITDYQIIPKPTLSDDLFAYKMRQYLIWISCFPPDREMVEIDTNLLKTSTEKPQPLYSLLKEPEEKNTPSLNCMRSFV